MPPLKLDSTELPVLSPRNRCVLLPRDPNYIYAYWDYTQADIDRVHDQLKFEGTDAQLVLRVYDTTQINFNGSNANHTWDLDVGFSARNWYIHVWQDNADYCAELGFRCGAEKFIPLTRSNVAHTPPKSTSKRDDLIWQDIKTHKESQPYIEEEIKGRYQGLMKQNARKKTPALKQQKKGRTYHLTAQDIRAYYMKLFASVSKKSKVKCASLAEIIKRKWQGGGPWQKVQPIMTSPGLIERVHPGASMNLVEKEGPNAQAGISTSASEGRLIKRKFFFEVWTELIVHGRTEPDAAVWLNEQGIKLNPDGTFSLRYALPDGEIPLKFVAKSSDAVEQRHIETRVERQQTISFPKMLKEFHG